MQLQGQLFKHQGKGVLICLAIILMLFSLIWITAPGAAQAASPAGSLEVNIVKDGEVVPVHTYTIDEMTALTGNRTLYYSSIDSMPAPVITIAKGVTLNALAADINAKFNAGITIGPDTCEGIKLYATDGWATTYAYNFLYGATRYYYPELVNKWDSDNQVASPGADANPEKVEPVLATHSYQARFLADLNPGQMIGPGDTGSALFRFCFGQTAADIASGTVTNNRFAKCVNRLDIILLDADPFQDWPAVSVEPVPCDKTWTVRFNQPVSGSQSLGEHIYVTNAGGERLETICKITADQKSIEVFAPREGGYRSGDSCTLWIKGSLSSATGALLKQPVKMRFKIS